MLYTILSDRAKRKLNLDISVKRSILAQCSRFSCPFESMYQAFTLIYAFQSQFRIQLIVRQKCFIVPSYHGGPLYIQESCGIGTPSKHSPEIFRLIYILYPSSQSYSFFTSTDISVTEFEKMFTLYKEGYWQRRERVPCCSACTSEVRVIRGEHLLSAYSSFYRIFFDILCLNQ